MTEPLRGIDINLLTPLHALLAERNLTRAGARANLSTPAISSALRRLRAHFEDDLLVTDGRDLRLTPLGERLLALTADAVDAAEALLGTERPFDPDDSTKTFTIGLSEYAMTVLAEPLRSAFNLRAPGCSLSFDSIPNDRSKLERHLMNRDLIVAPLDFELPGVVVPLFRDRIVCLVDSGNPRLVGARLSLEDLAALPQAQARFSLRNGRPPAVDSALASYNLAPSRIRVVVSNLLTLPFVISGTDLYGFVPSRLAAACPPGLGLRVATTDLPESEVVEGVYWHPTRNDDASGKWLREVLRDIAADLEPWPSSRGLDA